MTDFKKTYFVFTDSSIIKSGNDVIVIYQEKLKWPYLTLLRFHMFSNIESQLKSFKYAFFFNSNIIFKELVNSEILPITENLVGAVHPGYIKKDINNYKYEDNPLSTAFLEKKNGTYYFMGGFFGGKISAFLEMVDTIKQNIDKDLKNKLIARWHDESHLNRYFRDKQIKTLDESYIYAENFDSKLSPKILILDKNNFGGHIFLREMKLKKVEILKNYIKKILYK